MTAQAVARAQIDDRSVERSICVTCTVYVWMLTTCTGYKPQYNNMLHVLVCECASSTLSSQANSHYDITERLLKTSKGAGYASYKYSRRLWTLSSRSSSASVLARPADARSQNWAAKRQAVFFRSFAWSSGIWDKIELPWTFFSVFEIGAWVGRPSIEGKDCKSTFSKAIILSPPAPDERNQHTHSPDNRVKPHLY